MNAYSIDYQKIEFTLHAYLVQIQDMLELLDADKDAISVIKNNIVSND